MHMSEKVIVAPSILSADFAPADEVARVKEAEWLHTT